MISFTRYRHCQNQKHSKKWGCCKSLFRVFHHLNSKSQWNEPSEPLVLDELSASDVCCGQRHHPNTYSGQNEPAETDPSHSLINVIDNGRENLTSQKNYVYISMLSHTINQATEQIVASRAVISYKRAWIISSGSFIFSLFFSRWISLFSTVSFCKQTTCCRVIPQSQTVQCMPKLVHIVRHSMAYVFDVALHLRLKTLLYAYSFSGCWFLFIFFPFDGDCLRPIVICIQGLLSSLLESLF